MRGKTIVLGVGGSISAYKAADLCSKLVQEGATVYPILTKGALRFVQPATFWGLAGMPVSTDTFDEPFGPQEIAHLRYAELADLFVIAPASADLIAQIAHGFAGDMLTSALVANVRKPVVVAPAMNTDMWANPAVRENRRTMERHGYIFIEPGTGRLAEGVVGAGRLPEPPEIVAFVRQMLLAKRDLNGVRVLVTAGPTREPIDPVRFLSNRSSGKMGYAIVESAVKRGARVTLVTGPTALPIPAGVAETVRVETAAEMQEAVLSRSAAQDVIVQSAAIADFRPAQVAPQKLKKSSGVRAIELAQTDDFSITLGRQKRAGQTLVGFAAETEKMEEHALAKLRSKNLDLLIANDITLPGAGFEVDTNIVTFYRPGAEPVSLPQQAKRIVAEAICDEIVAIRGSRHPSDLR
jgi:phosphopantothenoylcysteine decarboxylase/phosphopantothenate--cysteine ligase